MTTIVYNHKEQLIAFDSRMCRGQTICTDEKMKLQRKGDVVFILCGSVAEIEKFIDAYPNINEVLGVSGVMIANGQPYDVMTNKDGELAKCRLEFNDAFGSGEEFALAALDFGKGAIEAVEYAKTRDAGTGGKVHAYSLEKGELL